MGDTVFVARIVSADVMSMICVLTGTGSHHTTVAGYTEYSHTIVAWWLSGIRRGYFYGYCEGLVSK